MYGTPARVAIGDAVDADECHIHGCGHCGVPVLSEVDLVAGWPEGYWRLKDHAEAAVVGQLAWLGLRDDEREVGAELGTHVGEDGVASVGSDVESVPLHVGHEPFEARSH
jgi:hypothetical protein